MSTVFTVILTCLLSLVDPTGYNVDIYPISDEGKEIVHQTKGTDRPESVQDTAGQQEEVSLERESLIRTQVAFTALTLAFGLLHLILFFFLPKLRSNLYFSIFLLSYGIAIYFDFEHLVTNGIIELRLHRAFMAINFIFALRFFYELFFESPPRQFYVISFALIIGGILATIEPHDNFKYVLIPGTISWLELIRIGSGAIRQKLDGAWILAVGFGTLMIFALYDLFLDIELIASFRGIENGYQFGLVGLTIATSVYLARDIARTNDRLIEKEREAKEKELEHLLLEAEDTRKTKELEEARALQMSMLPQELPVLSSVEIAVHMQTATEVGGDYYDFHQAEDGTLTVAIGDATGHGLKAGMMVAIVKSMFKRGGSVPDIRAFFEDSTRVLKQMDLGNLFMGLTLLQITDGRLSASAAGMPPIMIYRKADREIETVTLKGMPLGAFHNFPYQYYESNFSLGDTVLLMSDGFPELFDRKREMFGMERAEKLFQEIGDTAPNEIINRLQEEVRNWGDDQAPEDDVTFVVLGMRDGE